MKTYGGGQSRCDLGLARSPEVHGLRLGMTLREAILGAIETNPELVGSYVEPGRSTPAAESTRRWLRCSGRRSGRAQAA